MSIAVHRCNAGSLTRKFLTGWDDDTEIPFLRGGFEFLSSHVISLKSIWSYVHDLALVVVEDHLVIVGLLNQSIQIHLKRVDFVCGWFSLNQLGVIGVNFDYYFDRVRQVVDEDDEEQRPENWPLWHTARHLCNTVVRLRGISFNNFA